MTAAKPPKVVKRSPAKTVASRAQVPSRPPEGDLTALVRELQAHQEEIDIQNEELRVTQSELESQNEALRSAEDELTKLKDLYTDLFENAPAGYFVVDTTSARIVDVNQTACALLGLAKPEVKGSVFTRFLETSSADVTHICWRRAMRSRTTAACEVQMRRGAGTLFWAALRIRPEHEGPTVRVAASDITESKKAQEALKESERGFRAIAEAAPVFISVTRISDGQILFINRSSTEAFGYKMSDLLGQQTTGLYVDPTDRDSIMDAIRGNGFLDNHEVRLRQPDGAPFWVSASMRAINYGGEPAVLSAITDITEQKKVEELKDDFIGMVSH